MQAQNVTLRRGQTQEGTMTVPELSVIIPCHRSGPRLEYQLRALDEQEDPPAFEVVLCDNGGNENLPDRLAAAGPFRHPVRIIKADEHPGAAYARNRGLASTTAPLVGFVDDDDLVHPRWVRRAVEVLEDHAVVSGGVVLRTDDELDGLDYGRLLEILVAGTGPVPPAPAGSGSMGPALLGGNFVARREAILRVHGFDAALVRGAEDNDLAYRLTHAGYTIMDYGAMSILYCVPGPGRSRLKKRFRAGSALAQAVAARGAWSETAELRRPPMGELARSLGGLARMALGLTERDVDGALTRASTAAGLSEGWVRYRLLRRPADTLIGLGLEESA